MWPWNDLQNIVDSLWGYFFVCEIIFCSVSTVSNKLCSLSKSPVICWKSEMNLVLTVIKSFFFSDQARIWQFQWAQQIFLIHPASVSFRKHWSDWLCIVMEHGIAYYILPAPPSTIFHLSIQYRYRCFRGCAPPASNVSSIMTSHPITMICWWLVSLSSWWRDVDNLT